MPDDRIQREIEDILNKLDDFVPDETVASRMRRRSSDAATSFGRALIAPLARISLGQVMLMALALIVIAFFGRRVQPLFANWVLIAGVLLFLTSFGLSFLTRGSAPQTEKRWRGRSIELRGPTFSVRLRAWWQRRRSRR